MQVTAQGFNSPVVECQEEMGLPPAIPGDGTMPENPAGSPRLPGLARHKMFPILHVSLNLADDWDDPIRLFHVNHRLLKRKTSDPELCMRFEDIKFSRSLVSLSFRDPSNIFSPGLT